MKRKISRFLPLLPVCVLLLLFSGCAPGDAGAAAEVYDAQIFAAANRPGSYWTPLTLDTVVIAVDKSRTDAVITSWADLPICGALVNINDTAPATQMLIAALCYGLEGENFTRGSAAKYLEAMYWDGALKFKDPSAPVQICFDSEAAAAKKDNPDIEIIVPAEGTLSFVRGLFSSSPPELPDGTDIILISSGLRLPDGRCDAGLYPGAAEYGPAKLLSDYTHMAEVTQDMTFLRRTVRHTRLYTSADGFEHVMFGVVFIMAAVVWTASIMRRALLGETRRSVFTAGALLAAWMLMRVMKFAMTGDNAVVRYSWYMYYFFQLALPLVMLRITSLAGAVEGKTKPPLLFKYVCALNSALFFFVITNDLHNWVFKLYLTYEVWVGTDYSYGIIYYIVMAAVFGELIAAVVILFAKAKNSPRRLGFVFPLIFIGALMTYSGGYAAGIKFFSESDMTMVICVFALLFLELCIQTGQVPVNTAYKKLFKSAANNLRIAADAPAQTSADGGNTLLFSKKISGGYAVWQVDISVIAALEKQIDAANRRLHAANALLEKEGQLKSKAAESKAKAALSGALERDLGRHRHRLSVMLSADLPEDGALRGARIAAAALLVCYIKRKCRFLFIEMDSQKTVAPGELAAYADELAEIAKLGGVNCVTVSGLREEIPIRRAALFYDFLGAVLEHAVQNLFGGALVNMTSENGQAALKIMLPQPARGFEPDESLTAAVKAGNGTVEITDLYDDTAGFILAFPEGGAGVD